MSDSDLEQALPQPAYKDNWFAQPPLPNNFQWDVDATAAQMNNNQKSYPARGWATYPDGTSSNAESTSNMAPIDDWIPGQEPSWTPIAGGKGYGTPELSKGPPTGSGVAGLGGAGSTAASAPVKPPGGGNMTTQAGKGPLTLPPTVEEECVDEE